MELDSNPFCSCASRTLGCGRHRGKRGAGTSWPRRRKTGWTVGPRGPPRVAEFLRSWVGILAQEPERVKLEFLLKAT